MSVRLKFIAIATFLAALLYAQSAPTVQSAYAKETIVTGTASIDSGPITIYNTTFPARAKVGSGSVGRDGKFAVAVKTRLVQGHRLVAVDRTGKSSPIFTVQAPRSGEVPIAPVR